MFVCFVCCLYIVCVYLFTVFVSQRACLPPIVTHNVIDDANDPVLCHLRLVQLFNCKKDRVKVGPVELVCYSYTTA